MRFLTTEFLLSLSYFISDELVIPTGPGPYKGPRTKFLVHSTLVYSLAPFLTHLTLKDLTVALGTIPKVRVTSRQSVLKGTEVVPCPYKLTLCRVLYMLSVFLKVLVEFVMNL